MVVSEAERAAVEQVASSVPGVASVDNQLRVMAASRLFTSSKV
ncbi:MAG TPA: BON domain-containing protein [Burkholderiaceae bacterium]